jgi:branched-chain amino acid transport system permease protein
MIAALAGMLQILLNKKVGPELLGISNTVNPLLMTIIGGIGTFTGPIVGAGGLHLLDTVLRESVVTIGNLTIRIADVWELILGGIFMITVIIFPQGIVGTWQRWRGRRVG